MRKRRYSGRQILDNEEEQNPLTGVANLFDIAMVFSVALLVALVMSYQLPELLSLNEDITIVKNPGQHDMKIIIKEEALMNDKLGKQMKSFTDWLKSMKNLHPGKLPEQNEVVEKIIQSSAELSNEDAGILTETMAEVLIKQGKRHKAIEMYEKLSLMNPLKSIYFAAKIESLKN